MNIAKKFFAGALVAFVALAMTASAFAYTHMGTLKAGSMGTQVMSLQSGLSSLGFIAGTPDGKFGPMTAAAVRAFQASKGVAADAVVGPTTGALLQAATATTGTGTGTNNNNGGFDLNNLPTGGDEATLDKFDLNSLDKNPKEGDQDIVIYDADMTWEDSDVLVERLDAIFVPAVQGSGAGENENIEPSEIFEKLVLKFNGDEVATINNADDSDEYQDSTYDDGDVSISLTPDAGDLYSVRFSGLRFIAEEGEETNIQIVADFSSSFDIDDEWAVVIPAEGIRVTDGAMLVSTTGLDDDAEVFTLDEEGTDNKLTIRDGDDNPESGLLAVDDSSKSDEETIAIVEVEVDEDSEDVEFKDFDVTLTVTNTGGNDAVSDLVSKITVKAGSEEVEGDLVPSTIVTGATSTVDYNFEFDKNDLIIDSGDTEDFEFLVEFNASSGYDEGDVISLSMDSDDINAKGDSSNNTLSTNQLNSSFTGEDFELREDGIVVTLNDTMEVSKDIQGSENDYAELTIKFDVKAIGETAYIVDDATETGFSTASTSLTLPSTTEGVGYHINMSAGGTATASVPTLTSTAQDMGDSFKVIAGDTETFTLKVVVPNATVDLLTGETVRAILTGIGWNVVNSSTATDIYTLNLEDDFRTGTAYIND